MVLGSSGQGWVGNRPRVLPWSREGFADRIRLGVRSDGIHAVSADEIATATGIPVPDVRETLLAGNISLTCQGENVMWSLSNDQLFFKGGPAFSKRVPENVYWLKLSSNPVPAPASGVLSVNQDQTNEWVMDTLTLQGTNEVSYLTIGTLTNLPSFLAFKQITGGANYSVTLSWPYGVTNRVPGEVTVTLLSASSGETSMPDDHSARVSVNGVVVGTPFWSNECYTNFAYTVPASVLTNGPAVIRVENLLSAASTTRFFWTKVALTFPRRADAPYNILYPSIRGVCDADGFASDNQADYVVLIPPEGWIDGFRETINPLVQFRAKQGLRTAVMDVEALYNRFTQGLADPEAIRAFCWIAHAGPDVRLKYLVLAGSGSLDFAHEKFTVSDYNPCLIPPLLASQRFETGETRIIPVDQAFGDVSGDAVPEIAVGRFPTARTQELAIAVSKTLAYEETMRWKANAALSADYTFTSDMNCVSNALAEAGKTVSAFYPANVYGLKTVWDNGLKPALQGSAGVFWYIGHSSTTSLGGDSTLMNNSTLKTVSWTNMPIAILMGCHINMFHAMNITTEDAASLGSFGLFRPGSGFSAVFASAGYVADGAIGPSGECQMLAFYLAEASDAPGVFRLGDAIIVALQHLALYDPPINPIRPHYDPPPISPERLQSYSLVGDPAVMWRHDYSSAGTPASWLQSHGLTAWDGDVSDRDGDGWLAWQEYQAGTRPETNQFRIVVQTLNPDSGRMGLSFETEASKNYRVLWKYSLEGAEPWESIAWSWGAQSEALHPSHERIIPNSPVSNIYVPVRPGDLHGFYRIQKME